MGACPSKGNENGETAGDDVSAQVLEFSASMLQAVAAFKEVESQELEEFEALLRGPFNPRSEAFVTVHCRDKPQPSLLLLIIDGIVYDATVFAPTHKAGANIIRKNVGKECGDTFRRIHGEHARKLLETFRIGPLIPSVQTQGAGPQSSTQLLTAGGPSNTAASSSHASASHSPRRRHEPEGTRVLSSTPVSHNTRKVRFASGDKLPLSPGGHVLVTEPGGGIARSYTPFHVDESSYTILVKQYPGGVVSSYLHSLAAGDTVDVSPPLDPSVQWNELLALGKSIVLVGGGTGVAPIYSLAKAVVSAAAAAASSSTVKPPRCVLFACFRNEDDALLSEEVAELANQYGAFLDVYFVFSQQDISRHADRPAFTGRLSRAHLEATVQVADCGVICGPAQFGESVSTLLQEHLNIPPQNVFIL